MDLSQNKFFADLGRLSDRIKTETLYFLKDMSVYLFLPATYDDATNKEVMGNIVRVIKNMQNKYGFLDYVVLGLDMAKTKKQFLEVKKIMSQIPNSIVIWNDAPEMLKLKQEIAEKLELNLEVGKGLNMWTGLGYKFLIDRQSVFVIHDCDIRPEIYDENVILSLLAPIAHPAFATDFVKAYYTRLTPDGKGGYKLSARVKRLLVKPLVEAMIKDYADHKMSRDYLEFLQSFNYPLSGEFAMKANVVGDLRVQSDWGLEIGTINNLFGRNYKSAQVGLGIYDHKHSEEHPENPRAGLNRMAEEVTKTIFRKLYTLMGKDALDHDRFVKVLYDYEKYAKRHMESYEMVSKMRGWSYNNVNELARINLFKNAIIRAYETFKKDPDEMRPLILWDEVPRKYRRRLREIIDKYNNL